MRSFGALGTIDISIGLIKPIFLKFGISIMLANARGEEEFFIRDSKKILGESIPLETKLVAVMKHLDDAKALEEETIDKLKELSLEEFSRFLQHCKTKIDESSSYFIGSSVLLKGKITAFFDDFFSKKLHDPEESGIIYDDDDDSDSKSLKPDLGGGGGGGSGAAFAPTHTSPSSELLGKKLHAPEESGIIYDDDSDSDSKSLKPDLGGGGGGGGGSGAAFPTHIKPSTRISPYVRFFKKFEVSFTRITHNNAEITKDRKTFNITGDRAYSFVQFARLKKSPSEELYLNYAAIEKLRTISFEKFNQFMRIASTLYRSCAEGGVSNIDLPRLEEGAALLIDKLSKGEFDTSIMAYTKVRIY